MLDEPQHRVGEDVVEAVVGVGRGLDQTHEVLAAGRRSHLERPSAVAARGGRVVLAHRRGDPDHLTVRRQAAERGDQAAAAALHRTVGLERDRTAVGDQYQAALLLAHLPTPTADGPGPAVDASSTDPVTFSNGIVAGCSQVPAGRSTCTAWSRTVRMTSRAIRRRSASNTQPGSGGRVSVKLVLPGVEAISSCAFMCSASSRAMARPRPAPCTPSAL